ncbi:trehalose-phosphatase [Roseomonas sp. SSH11]|uniref:Trehalose 6-phosphate phosphatase n=1 Tax=Pararoseomonas baculiformis TaxID=2820812 RepID=A0ABS4AJV7_9PROT|nr:trehalose-phosphatase [Pararoseomonas baculiformis]MBP0446768.1 trehalose-phosphatase [Pararoseomonas baculiformis]
MSESNEAGPSLPGPPLPGPDTALFLDMDGTLLDIAARPDAVVVPEELPGLLMRLQEALGGAVAVVTGRGLSVARGYAGVPDLPIGAEHGAVLDPALPGAPPLPVPPSEWRRAADEWAAARPGTLAEHKTHGLVLHFRQRPEAEPEALALLRELLAGGDGSFRILPAHAAAELRPVGADKGGAVHRLMAVPPFTGRRPIFIGDDVTDEDGMAACAQYGGYGLRVPDDFAGRPALVRSWLARVANAVSGGEPG